MAWTSGFALPAGFLLPAEPGATEQQWTSRLVPRNGRRYTLHLSGSLHYAWAGRLAAGLAARHIGIVRGTARRGSTRWTAEIDLEVLDGAPEPSAIDFIALLREAGDPLAGPIDLAHVRAERTRRDLEVEIRGTDAIGLLGRILRIFAELGLYPHAMAIATAGAAVLDRFLLQDAAGRPPSDAAVAELVRRLEALVSPA